MFGFICHTLEYNIKRHSLSDTRFSPTHASLRNIFPQHFDTPCTPLLSKLHSLSHSNTLTPTLPRSYLPLHHFYSENTTMRMAIRASLNPFSRLKPPSPTPTLTSTLTFQLRHSFSQWQSLHLYISLTLKLPLPLTPTIIHSPHTPSLTPMFYTRLRPSIPLPNSPVHSSIPSTSPTHSLPLRHSVCGMHFATA